MCVVGAGAPGQKVQVRAHLREEFICRALDSILAPMSSMPLPLRSTLARQVLLPRALMRMLVRSFSRESATDSDCRDWAGKWELGPVSTAPVTAGPLPGPVTHTILFLDQLHQLVEDLLHGPAGNQGSEQEGRGLSSCYWRSREGAGVIQ